LFQGLQEETNNTTMRAKQAFIKEVQLKRQLRLTLKVVVTTNQTRCDFPAYSSHATNVFFFSSSHQHFLHG
jgi:hypothetical protein